MFFGPVFIAEMLTGARRSRYIAARVGYGLILLSALFMVYSSYWRLGLGRETTQQEYAAATFAFFMTFSWLQLFGVVLIAPAVTAGTISGERERRTIEYLFATDLTNWEIIFGKFTAALLRATAFLLVGPPILTLAMWMGGVAPDRLLAVFLITISTLITVTSLAIAVSVWSPRARQATLRCYVTLAIVLLVPPFIAGMLLGGVGSYPTWTRGFLFVLEKINRLFLTANPFYVLSYLMRGAIGAATFSIWQLVRPLLIAHGIVTVVCLVAAPLAVRRIHLRSMSAGAKDRKVRRRRSVGAHAMLWKELYAEQLSNRFGVVARVLFTLVFGLMASFVGWSYWKALTEFSWGVEYFQWMAGTVGTVLACLLILFIGARAATVITSEKERDTWIMLLGTPLEPRQIILAKWLGVLYSVRWFLPLFAILWILTATLQPLFLFAMPPIVIVYGLLAAFAAALGVWCSLWTANSTRALGTTIGTLIILGGAYLPFSTCCVGWATYTNGNMTQFLVANMLAPCMVFLLGMPQIVPLWFDSSANWDSGSMGMVSGWGMGVVGYAVSSVFLLRAAIRRFDHLTGRVQSRPLAGSHPMATPAPPADAIVID